MPLKCIQRALAHIHIYIERETTDTVIYTVMIQTSLSLNEVGEKNEVRSKGKTQDTLFVNTILQWV